MSDEAQVDLLEHQQTSSLLQITIKEGKNRQVPGLHLQHPASARARARA
jgi:16S rRNA U516 pseudouridylate synthase RsuA-like enzyme